jgi:uncharacterized protein (TIGR01244 family)
MVRSRVAGLFAVSFLLGACASPRAPSAPAAIAVHLEPAACGSIERLHVAGDVYLASQPRAADFERLRALGVKTILNVRREAELGEFDEHALVEQLGLTYVSVPFSKADDLTDETLDLLRKQLSGGAERPMLFHCHSGNRVGAVWLAHRVLDGGLTWEAALEEAKTVGMKPAAYEARIQRYVESRRK